MDRLEKTYVQPSKIKQTKRSCLQLLKTFPYKITEESRHWAEVTKQWLLERANFNCFIGVSQLFIYFDNRRTTNLITAKVTDDMLILASVAYNSDFIERIEKLSTMIKANVEEAMFFNS